MKLLIYRIAFLLVIFASCNSKVENYDTLNKYPIIVQNIPTDIKIKSFESFKFNSDFEFPKHSYILLTGKESTLLSFIQKVGLLQFTEKNIALNSTQELHEYNGGKLWDIQGAQEDKNDTIIREKLGIGNIQNASYAIYFNSGIPNKTFQSFNNNWNGKIIAILRSTSCILFIEELKSPKYQRVPG